MALAAASTVTITATDNTAEWGNSKTYSKLTTATGQAVLFTWTSGTHTVHQFASVTAYNACDFTGATELKASTVGTTAAPGSYTYTAAAGTHYFGCATAGHCASGQKIEVQVTDATTCTNTCTTAFNACKPSSTNSAALALCQGCKTVADKCASFCGQTGNYQCGAANLMINPVVIALVALFGFVVSM
eukprot:NODE_7295_length_777_cov_44.279817_g7054_i0.p1 GENE.NODE_7295_length_777_cov_44.279817_g7054_i0~~NODE_7295_length_777_cov_44.279817_g7054_i0.p1  ORF type:complete len:188 (+),score=65.55 NODE_7295_length_777_cov_44.279817_g7054_i0:103-666(+)